MTNHENNINWEVFSCGTYFTRCRVKATFLNARLAPEGYRTALSCGVFLLLSFLSFECIDKILVSPTKYCKDTEVYTIETKKKRIEL